MFVTQAYAQTAGAAAGAAADPMAGLVQFLPFVLIFVLFYFLMIRPQQKRMKEHEATIKALKRGDTVVLFSGTIGKIVRVEDAEAQVEIATGVNVRVVKSMITEVRTRGEPVAANETKN